MMQGVSPQFEGTQHNKSVAEPAGPLIENDAEATLAPHPVTAESLPVEPLSPEPVPALLGDASFAPPPSPRCFSCHERGHIARRCPMWAGRCFNCREEGHASRDCPRAPSRRSRSRRAETQAIAAPAGARHASASPSPVPLPAPVSYARAVAGARLPSSASPFPRPASETPGLSAAVSESVATQLATFHRAITDELRLLRGPANSVPASSVAAVVSESVVACLAPLFRLLGDELRLYRESLCTPPPKTNISAGLRTDSEGDASKEATPPGDLDCDDYDADLEAFEAELVLLHPSPSERAMLHAIEEESTHRAAVQADSAAFFRGVDAALVTAAALASSAATKSLGREFVAGARAHARFRFVDCEAAARREIESTERFDSGEATATFFAQLCAQATVDATRRGMTLACDVISSLGGAAERIEAIESEAEARRELEDAALTTFHPIPAPAGERGPVIAADSVSNPVMPPEDARDDPPEADPSLSGDAVSRDPVIPAPIPRGRDLEAPTEAEDQDLAYLRRPSVCTDRYARKPWAKGGYRPSHRSKPDRGGEFMRAGDARAYLSDSSDPETPTRVTLRLEDLACPAGHPLKPSAIPVWCCDECGASGDGETSMACRACDYDVCTVCVEDTVGPPEPAVAVATTALDTEAPRR